MENTNLNYKNIPGWNSDADPENEPTYPMKNIPVMIMQD
jgi:hypothetical protein